MKITGVYLGNGKYNMKMSGTAVHENGSRKSRTIVPPCQPMFQVTSEIRLPKRKKSTENAGTEPISNPEPLGKTRYNSDQTSRALHDFGISIMETQRSTPTAPLSFTNNDDLCCARKGEWGWGGGGGRGMGKKREGGLEKRGYFPVLKCPNTFDRDRRLQPAVCVSSQCAGASALFLPVCPAWWWWSVSGSRPGSPWWGGSCPGRTGRPSAGSCSKPAAWYPSCLPLQYQSPTKRNGAWAAYWTGPRSAFWSGGAERERVSSRKL